MTENYYLLLGIPHGTIKPEVIRVAAESRMNECREAFDRLQKSSSQKEIGEAYDYALLEVSPAAPLTEIKEATQRKIGVIKEAYHTLINPTKRIQYDQALEEDSSLNETPLIFKQSTQKHPPLKKTAPPVPIPSSSPLPIDEETNSSINWLWLFVAVGLLAIAAFLGLKLLK
jgi:hypothetical protein